jgi:Flp pilus assembly CpaF family ATPase
LIFEDIGLDVAAFESFSQLPPSAALRLATKAEESTTRSINVLVVGKKGTGKTTLINYLLGQVVCFY